MDQELTLPELARLRHEVLEAETRGRGYLRTDEEHDGVVLIHLTNPRLPRRNVRLGFSWAWTEAAFSNLGLMATLVDDMPTIDDKSDEMRQIVRLAVAYLEGSGRVEYRPTWLPGRPRRSMTIEADGLRWTLGQAWGRWKSWTSKELPDRKPDIAMSTGTGPPSD